jgi:hypothetical protein
MKSGRMMRHAEFMVYLPDLAGRPRILDIEAAEGLCFSCGALRQEAGLEHMLPDL